MLRESTLLRETHVIASELCMRIRQEAQCMCDVREFPFGFGASEVERRHPPHDAIEGMSQCTSLDLQDGALIMFGFTQSRSTHRTIACVKVSRALSHHVTRYGDPVVGPVNEAYPIPSMQVDKTSLPVDATSL